MVTKFQLLLLVILTLCTFTGCATTCRQGDGVCEEKQKTEYGRSFYEPMEYR